MSQERIFRILLVCTGNTCRSAMAEGLLKRLIEHSDVQNVTVSSAGTDAMIGRPATLFAIEAAKARGVDISRHISRKLNERMVQEVELILTMEQEHLGKIRRVSRNSAKKSYLLKLFPEKKDREGDFDIADPIGGDLEDYNEAFLEIEQEMERILPHIRKSVAGMKTE